MVTVLACMACLLTRDSTPESTVQGMFDALNKHDWKGVFSRIEGAKVDQVVPEFEKLASVPTSIPKFVLKMTTLTATGDSASGTVSIGTEMGVGANSPTFQEDEVHLHRTNGDWKIVDGKGKNSLFSQLGQIARDPSKMQQSRDAAQRTVILSNLKQIALGIMMYLNDHDDRFSIKQATLKASLNPYIKSDKVWVGPDGKPLDVRLNPALVGKAMSSVPEPANCVLLTIGPKENLRYFQDRTVVAYVDGHVKLVSRGAVASLKWK